ncbi:MAG: molybdenum cofactor biosynthesis protein MoaE [Candidatus Bathycorpusculaceae bacterium]
MLTYASVHEKGKITLIDLLNNLKAKDSFSKAGAIAIFIGVVRGETLKSEKVQKLTLEAYEEKANESLTKICDELRKKTGIVDVQIHHLLGEFKVSEDLVYVLVAGEHRKNVFPVLEEAVERYKREAPIFKKEEILTCKGEKAAYWVTEKDI